MKKYVLIFCIGGILLSCREEKEGYNISGSIKGAGDGQAILMQWEDRQSIALDTVELKEGTFVFSGVLDEPVSLSIQICPEKQQSAAFGFIAENSPIRVAGKWSDVKDEYGYRSIEGVTITGSRNNDVYQEIMNVYQDLLKVPQFKEYADVCQKLDELRATDKEGYYRLQEETEALEKAFKQAVLEKRLNLIQANKSVVSVVSCLPFLWNDMTLDELRQVYQVLDTNVQQSRMATELREELAVRERVKPGMPAPDFNLTTPDGSRLSLSDLRGKYVVLDFWASWCGPCRASFPEMKNIYARFKDKGLEILGVTNDSRKEDWLKALEQDQLPWKQVIDEFPIQYKPAKVATMYAIPYLPTLILIDPTGIIIGQAQDKHQLVEWLEERLPA